MPLWRENCKTIGANKGRRNLHKQNGAKEIAEEFARSKEEGTCTKELAERKLQKNLQEARKKEPCAKGRVGERSCW
jgi:hypothetical protein